MSLRCQEPCPFTNGRERKLECNEVTLNVIVQLLESAIAELHESIMIAQTALSEAEYEAFKRGAGMSLAKISYECLDPIYAEYPDLAPPGVL